MPCHAQLLLFSLILLPRLAPRSGASGSVHCGSGRVRPEGIVAIQKRLSLFRLPGNGSAEIGRLDLSCSLHIALIPFGCFPKSHEVSNY